MRMVPELSESFKLVCTICFNIFLCFTLFWTEISRKSNEKHTILKDFHGFSRNSTDSEILVLDDQASDSTKSKCFVKYGRCTLSRYAVLRVFHNVFATRRHQHAYKTGISYARSWPWSKSKCLKVCMKIHNRLTLPLS